MTWGMWASPFNKWCGRWRGGKVGDLAWWGAPFTMASYMD